MGMLSPAPGTGVHMDISSLQASCSFHPAASAGSSASQAGSQPVPPISGCAPAPGGGLLAGYASTNRRKRPTVTSKRSSRNALTDAGSERVGGWLSVLERKNDPPGTSRLAQQSSSPRGPQEGAAPPQLGTTHAPST